VSGEPAAEDAGEGIPESGGVSIEPAEAATAAAPEPGDGSGNAAEGGDAAGEKSDGAADGVGA
jgi:hypothetical protein